MINFGNSISQANYANPETNNQKIQQANFKKNQ